MRNIVNYHICMVFLLNIYTCKTFTAIFDCLATDLINQQIHMMTETGNKCQEILVRGEAIPEDMVIKMIEEKVNSQEVTHHGRFTILTQKYSHIYVL